MLASWGSRAAARARFWGHREIEIFRYWVRAAAELLAAYSIEELTVIQRFLEDALALQRKMTEKLLEREQKT
jgi:hypothetical protein